MEVPVRRSGQNPLLNTRSATPLRQARLAPTPAYYSVAAEAGGTALNSLALEVELGILDDPGGGGGAADRNVTFTVGGVSSSTCQNE